MDLGHRRGAGWTQPPTQPPPAPADTEVEGPCSGGGLPRRKLWVQALYIFPCFHRCPTTNLHCGGTDDFYRFSCAGGSEPHRKLLSLPGCCPLGAPSIICSSPTSAPALLSWLLPCGRGQTEPPAPCGVCKTLCFLPRCL